MLIPRTTPRHDPCTSTLPYVPGLGVHLSCLLPLWGAGEQRVSALGGQRRAQGGQSLDRMGRRRGGGARAPDDWETCDEDRLALSGKRRGGTVRDRKW